MTTPTLTMLRERIPALDLLLVGVDHYGLGAKPAARFDLLVFYQGLHCPVCTKYLSELARLEAEFEMRGLRSVAISFDGSEIAAKDSREAQSELCVLRLQPAAAIRPRRGSQPEPRPRRGARILQRAPRLSDQGRRNALLGSDVNDGVRRSDWCHGPPDYKGPPHARRLRGRGLRHGRTKSLRCVVVPRAFDYDLPEPGGHAQDLTMPTESCLLFHQRAGCNALLICKLIDCRLFCSYRSVKCSPKQVEGKSCYALSQGDEASARAPRVQSLNQGKIL